MLLFLAPVVPEAHHFLRYNKVLSILKELISEKPETDDNPLLLPICSYPAPPNAIIWNSISLCIPFPKQKVLPGAELADTTFYADHYLVKTGAAESKWQYDKILALAETQDYLIFVMGKNHALAMEKVTLEGGSISEFCHFIEEKSGRKIQNIGG